MWRTGEPMGKAGAYAVQGSGGGAYCPHERQSYSGIMGLPLFETAQIAALDRFCALS
jgi:septum formation protein